MKMPKIIFEILNFFRQWRAKINPKKINTYRPLRSGGEPIKRITLNKLLTMDQFDALLKLTANSIEYERKSQKPSLTYNIRYHDSVVAQLKAWQIYWETAKAI